MSALLHDLLASDTAEQLMYGLAMAGTLALCWLVPLSTKPTREKEVRCQRCKQTRK